MKVKVAVKAKIVEMLKNRKTIAETRNYSSEKS